MGASESPALIPESLYRERLAKVQLLKRQWRGHGRAGGLAGTRSGRWGHDRDGNVWLHAPGSPQPLPVPAGDPHHKLFEPCPRLEWKALCA